MLSAAAAKKATESKLKIEAQHRRDKAEQEQSAKNKRRAEVIAEALKILNATTDALISKAAHEGKNTVKLTPIEGYKLYGCLTDKAFLPFINKLKDQDENNPGYRRLGTGRPPTDRDAH